MSSDKWMRHVVHSCTMRVGRSPSSVEWMWQCTLPLIHSHGSVESFTYTNSVSEVMIPISRGWSGGQICKGLCKQQMTANEHKSWPWEIDSCRDTLLCKNRLQSLLRMNGTGYHSLQMQQGPLQTARKIQKLANTDLHSMCSHSMHQAKLHTPSGEQAFSYFFLGCLWSFSGSGGGDL